MESVLVSFSGLGKQSSFEKRLFSAKCVMTALFVGCGMMFSCETAMAQAASRHVSYRSSQYQSSHAQRNGRTPAPVQVTPVPDFKADTVFDRDTKTATDRLDRHNLPMLYHYTYDVDYRNSLAGMPVLGRQWHDDGDDVAPSLTMMQETAPDFPAPLPSLAKAGRVDEEESDLEVMLRRIQGSHHQAESLSETLMTPESEPNPVAVPTKRIRDNELRAPVRLRESLRISGSATGANRM